MQFWSRFSLAQRWRAWAQAPAPNTGEPLFNGISSKEIVRQICDISKLSLPRIKNAGFGVFVRPLATSTFPHIIKQGTVMALYPGVVFFPSISNHYVLQRMDSSMIDGKHSGLSKYMFKSIWKRITYDRNWLHLRKQGDCMSWSVGQLINNALNSATDANVVYNEFTLGLSFPAEHRAFIPNVPYAPEEADIHGIALVTTQDLVFEKMDQQVELLASYQSVHHGG
ncbi:hypothetical protein BJ741DRAFT_626248 [Chytriomyces cf. hyalinus JEL632]|nr:hypothetical protein BJ741DRAFT_626248 [Chytriomyces cf. hyalinus JEL632]